MKNGTLRFLAGNARYVDDATLPGMVYAGFVRSPYAHARIKNIDVTELKGSDVVFTLSGKDVEKLCEPFPVYLYTAGEINSPMHRCLTSGTVNFVGEPVFAIVVKDRYSVEDAIEKVRVEYEPLTPIVDSERAVQNSSPLVHEYLNSNVGIKFLMKGGDIDSAFQRSSIIIRRKFKLHRHVTAPMEPQGAIASYEAGTGVLTLMASTQLPFIFRSHLSLLIGLPENKIRVIAPDIGGGFGGKLQIAPEYVTLCLLAIKCGRPVKWIETRTENFLSFVHGREQIHEVEAAFSSEGILLGIRDNAILDAGAYLDSRLQGQAMNSVSTLEGPYAISAIHADYRIVLTNKCPYGAYRGFGGEAGSFIVERLMDLAAKQFSLDPAEIRRRNLVKTSEGLYKSCLGYEIHPGDYSKMLEKALEISEYEKFKAKKVAGQKIGIGLAIVNEPSSTNSYSGVAKSNMVVAGLDFGSARITVDSTGTVIVRLGTVSLGTNHDEVVKKVVSETLGLELDDVETIEGDTGQTPYDCGVRASRFSTIVLPAVIEAATELRKRIVKTAAKLLEAREDDLVLSHRQIFIKGITKPELQIDDVARLFYTNINQLPDDIPPGLDVMATFKPKERSGPFNCHSPAVHVPIVEIDTETGIVKILKYSVVEDCGNISSIDGVEGQISGGLAQVVGGIFYEEIKYDTEGQLLTSSFMDYLLPSAVEVPTPSIGHCITPSRFPGGSKGMGESSNLCGYPAIINAVNDALVPSIDVEINETALPPESVMRLISGNLHKRSLTTSS